ncbi:MAG: GatB/YqeY domain-containing protein [bacterium]|nr:GatB/YqeY domain-containing protein [bacterium]
MTPKALSIREEIERQLKEAQKQSRHVEISTLRLLLSSLKNYEIAHRGEEITDDSVLKVARQEVKKRHEAIEAYTKGGRNELAEKERQELEILQNFLPPEMSDDDIREIIDSVISELGESPNFGQVMGAAMKKAGPNVDGKKVNVLVKQRLNE